MKNPFYKAPVEHDPDALEEQDYFKAAADYLRTSHATEEVDDLKIRRTHPELQKEKVWEQVKAALQSAATPKAEAATPAPAPATPAQT